MNATPLQMIDRVAPDAPLLPILTVCQGLDRSRTKSTLSVVEEIKRLMVETSKADDVSPCDILSELMTQTLLSDDNDPCHIYAMDLMPACNEAMTGSK